MIKMRFERTDLPVLHECDVLVAGGSFGGVAAALALARAGRAVALVEPRTYLGREVTATLRPWVLPNGGNPRPDVISACIAASRAASAAPPAAVEIPLHLDAVKLCLEDLVLQAGIKLIYATLPVGLHLEARRLRGVVIGNKSGRQVVRCRAAVDATATALVARLAGAAFEVPDGTPQRYFATLEFTGMGPLPGLALDVPPELGLAGDRVSLHAGCRGAGHVLVEYGFSYSTRPSPQPSPGRPLRSHGEGGEPSSLPPVGCTEGIEGGALLSDELHSLARLQVYDRTKAKALAVHLRRHVLAFRDAYPATSSYELHGPQTMPLAGPIPDWAESLAEVSLDAGSSLRAGLSAFAGPLANLWCLNGAARVDKSLRRQLDDPVVAAHLGDGLGKALAGRWTGALAEDVGDLPEIEPPPLSAEPGERLSVAEPESPQQGRDYPRVPVAAAPIPAVDEVDLVVAGGGSSGAVAGIQAGLEGLRAVVVDMNPGLGGTGTYGGIYTYWFGQQNRYAETVLGWLNEAHDELGLPRPEGVLARWNVEARIWALAGQAERAGVEVMTNALVIGAIVAGKESGDKVVRGVVAATRYGPVALLARTVIDATGDGDVAAFAGAPVHYGSAREQAVMYAYMPQVPAPGRPRNVKTSMLDVRNVEDYTRMILAERRRRQEGDTDHGLYLAPRESRHVEGEVTLTLTDQLVQRAWPDAVTVAFSNHDIKGESTSDWIRMGLQAPNLEIEIPYRALLPRGLRNLLVVGKAYSMTHDASAGPRMQRDLENLGAAAAVAAALAQRADVPVGQVDVRALQARLVELGALPERVLERRLVPLSFTDAELRAQIAALDVERPLYAYADADVGELYRERVPPVDLMCAGPQVVPLLEEALEPARAQADGPRQLLLARMLAVLGSRAGVPVLVKALEKALSGECLPGRGEGVPHVGVPPDQGAAPEAAHLLYALGLARDRHALPLWRRVVDGLATATREALFDRHQALYFYAAAVCYGCERLGDPEAIPVLRQLHGYPPFHGHARPAGPSLAGVQVDYREERLAYLETLIGRALARCGSPLGYLALIDYLTDARALLAEHAHSELRSISGCDYGKNPAAWGQWLEEAGEDLGPVPWRGPSEPVAAWGESILIEPQEHRGSPG